MINNTHYQILHQNAATVNFSETEKRNIYAQVLPITRTERNHIAIWKLKFQRMLTELQPNKLYKVIANYKSTISTTNFTVPLVQ